MILLWSTFGLANRIFLFSHCRDLAEATGQTIISFNFPEADDFESGRHGTLLVWPVPEKGGFALSNFLRKCCTNVLRHYVVILQRRPWLGPRIVWCNEINCEELSAANPRFVEEIRSRRFTVLTGWIKLEDRKIRQPDALRAYFTPREPIRALCRRTVEQARGDADILVGIHIRWTSYSYFANGAFYFSLEMYVEYMKHFLTLFPGKKVAFLVVCDQPELVRKAWATFGSLQVTLGPGTKLGDLYSLAGCDYIVCPTSTYSLWAAFYGRKPCWRLYKDAPFPTLAEFVVPDESLYDLHPHAAA